MTGDHGRSPGRVRTFDRPETADVLTDRKRGQTISLCFPCRDEAGTIGERVASVRRALVERVPLLDEVVVLDDRSTDDTASVATSAGAQVVHIDEVHRVHGAGHGRGNARWASLFATNGELVVWCDSDVTSFRPEWVVRLVAPLLRYPSLQLVTSSSARLEHGGGGDRTTELVARPLLSLYQRHLAGLAQPLSGETAGRRNALEAIPFVEGWGVDLAMLIDVAREHGASAIGQVDLGASHHPHRSLHSLSVQAAEVMAGALARLAPGFVVRDPSLARPDGSTVRLNLAERPPVRSLQRNEAVCDAPR